MSIARGWLKTALSGYTAAAGAGPVHADPVDTPSYAGVGQAPQTDMPGSQQSSLVSQSAPLRQSAPLPGDTNGGLTYPGQFSREETWEYSERSEEHLS